MKLLLLLDFINIYFLTYTVFPLSVAVTMFSSHLKVRMVVCSPLSMGLNCTGTVQ